MFDNLNKTTFTYSEEPKFEYITHKIYLTNATVPLELFDLMQGQEAGMAQMVADFYTHFKDDEFGKWTHYMWTNVPFSSIPLTVELYEK